MDRQRCVINAIIKQANPANMLARYEDIAKAGKDIVYTDMPREVLPLMVDLSLRVKDGNVRSVVFKHGVDGFLSPDPDFALMRQAGQGGDRGDDVNGDSGSSPARAPQEEQAEIEEGRERGRRQDAARTTPRWRRRHSLPRELWSARPDGNTRESARPEAVGEPGAVGIGLLP